MKPLKFRLEKVRALNTFEPFTDTICKVHTSNTKGVILDYTLKTSIYGGKLVKL